MGKKLLIPSDIVLKDEKNGWKINDFTSGTNYRSSIIY
jgi:hypothetical protein